MSAVVRRGRGKSQASIDLVAAAIRILSEIQPASVRACCYKLFVEKRIPDMSKVSTDKVSGLLVWAREQGQLPWGWIVDETRSAERISTWANPDEIVEAAVSGYRKNFWSSQPRRVEVWTEKGTLRGTLAPVLDEFAVTLRVMHGYGSATAIHEAAQDSLRSDKPLHVLYLGDWDCSGLHMSEIDLPNRIDRYGGKVTMCRIALDASDTAPGTKLPSFPTETKAKDARFQWFLRNYGARCWEVDALSPPVLRERVRNEIEGLLDVANWNHAINVEKEERNSMNEFMSTWKRLFQGKPENSHGEQQ